MSLKLLIKPELQRGCIAVGNGDADFRRKLGERSVESLLAITGISKRSYKIFCIWKALFELDLKLHSAREYRDAMRRCSRSWPD